MVRLDNIKYNFTVEYHRLPDRFQLSEFLCGRETDYVLVVVANVPCLLSHSSHASGIPIFSNVDVQLCITNEVFSYALQ